MSRSLRMAGKLRFHADEHAKKAKLTVDWFRLGDDVEALHANVDSHRTAARLLRAEAARIERAEKARKR